MVTKEKSRLLNERNTLLKEIEMVTKRKSGLNKSDKEDLLLINKLNSKLKRLKNDIEKVRFKLK